MSENEKTINPQGAELADGELEGTAGGIGGIDNFYCPKCGQTTMKNPCSHCGYDKNKCEVCGGIMIMGRCTGRCK